MKTTLNKVLMTASVLTMVSVAAPAMANPSVLCSVRTNYDAALGDANYKPGVDAQGKAVAPADLAEPAMNVPTNLRIPLTVELAQRLNEVLPEGTKLEAEIGVVDVRQDGTVLINGKDLTGPTTAMCANLEKQKAAALKTKDAPKPKKRVAKKPVAPVEPVAAEPAAVVEPTIIAPAVEAPVEAAAPVVEPAVDPVIADPVAAPVADPVVAPQVLQAEPVVVPDAVAPAVPPSAEVPAPAPTQAPAEVDPFAPPPGLPAADSVPPAPTEMLPQDSGMLAPNEQLAPRAPIDPMTGQPVQVDMVPPAPSPVNNDINGGMLSGEAQ